MYIFSFVEIAKLGNKKSTHGHKLFQFFQGIDVIKSLVAYIFVCSWYHKVVSLIFSSSDTIFPKCFDDNSFIFFYKSSGKGSVRHQKFSVVFQYSIDVFDQKKSFFACWNMLETCDTDNKIKGLLFIFFDILENVVTEKFRRDIFRCLFSADDFLRVFQKIFRNIYADVLNFYSL